MSRFDVQDRIGARSHLPIRKLVVRPISCCVKVGEKRRDSAGIGVAGAVKIMLYEHMYVRHCGRGATDILQESPRQMKRAVVRSADCRAHRRFIRRGTDGQFAGELYEVFTVHDGLNGGDGDPDISKTTR